VDFQSELESLRRMRADATTAHGDASQATPARDVPRDVPKDREAAE